MDNAEGSGRARADAHASPGICRAKRRSKLLARTDEFFATS